MQWAKRLCSGLGRLARDKGGNALMIMTAALIPMAGMVGGGVDISRMYILKTRMQHACDAGVLAGRKAMGGGTWAYNDYYPRKQATLFFDGNFEDGSFGSWGLSRAFTENAGKVSGTVSATIPMTLMRIFGRSTETIAVTCDAEMRLPNTDVMFVLDTTGSMASKAASTDPDTKIESLKTAVKCFYEIVARLDTDAACTTGTPSGGTGTQVQIRFGFMPYSTNVNVGKLLPTAYFADSWTYQSREPEWTPAGSTESWVQQGDPTLVSSQAISQTGVPQSYCNPTTARQYGFESDSSAYSNNNNTRTDTATRMTNMTWSSANSGTCSGTQTKTNTVFNRVVTTNKTFNRWHYGPIAIDVSGLKNGDQWNNSFTTPTGSQGTARTITWDGCIEERATTQASSYDPIPSAAKDLDIDSAPVAGDSSTQWGPALQQLIYARARTSSWSQLNAADAYVTTDYYNSMPYFCPREARKLQMWPNATDFDNYVDSLYPTGNTYHDIGMLWGARFMSPTGIFKSENEYTPQGGEIERHMIFMTDGDAVSAPCDYTAYGVAWFDKRTTSDVGSASNCGNERSSLDDQVNARLTALCTAVKNKNITLWVISFGTGSNATTEGRLETCASEGRYFVARDSAALQQTFKSIADQISQLRLTK